MTVRAVECFVVGGCSLQVSLRIPWVAPPPYAIMMGRLPSHGLGYNAACFVVKREKMQPELLRGKVRAHLNR